MKKEYIKPEMSIVFLGDDIMQVITPGSPTDDFAKKHSFDLDVNHSIVNSWCSL